MADVFVNYSGDVLRGALEILEASDLKELVRPGMNVVLKPNLVLAKPPSMGAVTHSEVVEGLIIYLRDMGVSDPLDLLPEKVKELYPPTEKNGVFTPTDCTVPLRY